MAGKDSAVIDDMAAGGAAAHVVDEYPSDAMSRAPRVGRGDVTDDSHSDSPSFQEAFQSAKKKHSAPAEQAAPTKASTEDTQETGTPLAEKAEAAAQPADTAKPVATGLISDAEFTALQKTHADDPAALRKALEGAFTKKTQALADERRTLERLAPYQDLIDAYESDPAAVVRTLAEQNGIKLVDDGDEKAAAASGDETTATAVETVLEDFKASLGPDLEYLADGLAPAITKLVERLTQSTVEKTVAPLKKQQAAILNRDATAQSELVMESFGKDHPDWKDHEPAMLKLSQKLQPNGMSEVEYLGHLYKLVTHDSREQARDTDIEKKVAERVKATVEKMTKGAASSETRTDDTPDSQVRKRPTGSPTFAEAHAAAKRGERWED